MHRALRMRVNFRDRALAVVFDMDGLMLDTEPTYKVAWQRAAQDLGYRLHDSLYRTLIGRSEPDSEAELIRAFGADFPTAEFRRGWMAQWRIAVDKTGVSMKDGFLELLALLEERRTPIAIATSSDERRARFSLRYAGLEGRIRVVISGDQVELGKPAPDIFLEAARRLGVNPRDCVALEDSSAGIQSAVAARMTALMIPDLQVPTAEAIRAAFRVLPSLREATPILLGLLAGESTA